MEANKIREIRIIRENPRFRHYPEYKESGVEWIGKIPAHWESKKLGHVSTIFKGGTPKRNVDRYFQGDLPWARPVDITALKGALYINDTEIHISEEALGNSGARRLPAGTVLLTSRATIGVTAITTVPMATNQGFANFVCNERLLNIYLVYYLQAIKDLLISLGSGSTFLEVTKGTLVGVRIPLPPLSEQRAIVNFLNHKNQQIDELIRIKERRIELLQAQRTALINQIVTKGLDPNVEMKPSEVEWIREIPVHWKISKVKHEFKSLDNLRVPLNSETRGSMKLKVYDYYGASGIIDKVENYIFDEPLILIGEDGANLHLRSTPLAFKATGKYWVNNHAHVLKPKHGNIDYLTNMLESLDYTHYITGAAQPKLTSDHLMNITVIIPPPLEQAQIASFLDHKTKQIDELVSAEQRKIELLKEYRQSLISEAVTGKIDARNEV